MNGSKNAGGQNHAKNQSFAIRSAKRNVLVLEVTLPFDIILLDAPNTKETISVAVAHAYGVRSSNFSCTIFLLAFVSTAFGHKQREST